MNNQINNQINQQINQNMNQNNRQTSPQNRGKVMSKQVKNDPKYTENWLPLKAINNGIMYNNRNEMITGVKIQPRNIFILDQGSMDNALIGLILTAVSFVSVFLLNLTDTKIKNNTKAFGENQQKTLHPEAESAQ